MMHIFVLRHKILCNLFLFSAIFVFLFLSVTKAQDLQHFSVTESETLSASCTHIKPPTEKQMTDYLEYFITNPDAQVNAEYRGVVFKNEIPEFVELFKKIHEPFISTGKIKNLPATKCDKVLCAMEQYYGKGLPLRMLYIFAKYGISTSPESAIMPSNYRKWHLSEINDVLVALESLPPTLLPIKYHHLLHFLDGYSYKSYMKEGDSKVIANATIDVFDLWNQETRAVRIATIIHELGHVYEFNLKLKDQWKNMPKQYVSKYAKTNNDEDFAESFVAYRLAPKKLKSISPQRYSFIKDKVFNGLEFKNTKECDSPFNQFTTNIQNKLGLRREILAWTDNNKPQISTQVKYQEEHGSFKNKLWPACAIYYINEVDGGDKALTNQCLANVVRRRATLIELRRQNKSETIEQQISPKRLQDIVVSKQTIRYLRQDLKAVATELFDDAFRRSFWIYDTSDACLKQLDFFMGYSLAGYTSLNIPSSGIKTLFAQACKNKDQNHFWAGWLTSEFAPLLPN